MNMPEAAVACYISCRGTSSVCFVCNPSLSPVPAFSQPSGVTLQKDMIAYRLIDTQDQLERCQEQHNVLEHERDEARSCADAWWTEVSATWSDYSCLRAFCNFIESNIGC